MPDLTGKHGLIVGVANKRSIAWAIAKAADAAGARLAVTYQGERLGENVRELATELQNPLLMPLDVTSDGLLVLAPLTGGFLAAPVTALPADVGFIYFHFAGERANVFG